MSDDPICHTCGGIVDLAKVELQWFQIALKTWFWAGFLFAAVFAVSVGCLLATKYYHDQAVLRHNAMERDFRSYSRELSEAREKVREAGKIWYSVDQMKKEIEVNNGKRERAID